MFFPKPILLVPDNGADARRGFEIPYRGAEEILIKNNK
jgi:hypothetical protein